jgi:hypothetical protein
MPIHFKQTVDINPLVLFCLFKICGWLWEAHSKKILKFLWDETVFAFSLTNNGYHFHVLFCDQFLINWWRQTGHLLESFFVFCFIGTAAGAEHPSKLERTSDQSAFNAPYQTSPSSNCRRSSHLGTCSILLMIWTPMVQSNPVSKKWWGCWMMALQTLLICWTKRLFMLSMALVEYPAPIGSSIPFPAEANIKRDWWRHPFFGNLTKSSRY